MINFNEIQNLSEIQNEYECFFIDLWGVIHNGVNLFENVLDTLKFLKNKKKVNLLSYERTEKVKSYKKTVIRVWFK